MTYLPTTHHVLRHAGIGSGSLWGLRHELGRQRCRHRRGLSRLRLLLLFLPRLLLALWRLRVLLLLRHEVLIRGGVRVPRSWSTFHSGRLWVARWLAAHHTHSVGHMLKTKGTNWIVELATIVTASLNIHTHFYTTEITQVFLLQCIETIRNVKTRQKMVSTTS